MGGGTALGPAAFLLHLFCLISGEFGKPVSDVRTGFLKACVIKARKVTVEWGVFFFFLFPFRGDEKDVTTQWVTG